MEPTNAHIVPCDELTQTCLHPYVHPPPDPKRDKLVNKRCFKEQNLISIPYKYLTPDSDIESKAKAVPYISNAWVSSITMQITDTYVFFGRHLGEFCNVELHPEYMRLSSLSRPTARRSWWCRHGCTTRSRWCNHGCVAMRAPIGGRLAVIRGLNNQQSIFFMFQTNYLYLWILFFFF